VAGADPIEPADLERSGRAGALADIVQEDQLLTSAAGTVALSTSRSRRSGAAVSNSAIVAV